jgi:hypothetical protein
VRREKVGGEGNVYDDEERERERERKKKKEKNI